MNRDLSLTPGFSQVASSKSRTPTVSTVSLRQSIWLVIILLMVLSHVVPARASDFRISFLDQPSTLDDTCSILQAGGIPEGALRTFRRLVIWQNQGGNGVDTNRFPASSNGFYLFHGLHDFTNRTSQILAESKGKPTFMCFDAACLLLYGVGLRADSFDSDLASKNLIHVTPERELRPLSKEQLATGTNILTSAPDYFALVSRPRSDGETKLGMSLHAGRRLDVGATNSDSGLRAAFSRFLTDLQRDAFHFPTNFNLGMVFYVDTKRGFIKTDHAFLCFPHGRVSTILEKDNSTGPYVRADFESESDLAQYVSLGERRDTNNPNDVDFGASVLISINDRLIGMFRPERSPMAKSPPSSTP